MYSPVPPLPHRRKRSRPAGRARRGHGASRAPAVGFAEADSLAPTYLRTYDHPENWLHSIASAHMFGASVGVEEACEEEQVSSIRDDQPRHDDARTRRRTG